MLTRKQADKILNLQLKCNLSAIDVLNVRDGNHSLYETKLHEHSLACRRFVNYVESLVKIDDRRLDWTTVPLVKKGDL